LDNIHIYVYTTTYSVAGLQVLNVTDTSGVYYARLIVTSVSGSGNATIYLVNERYSSTTITIQNGVIITPTTNYIPYNSTDTLTRSGYIMLDASLTGGSSLTITLTLEYTTNTILQPVVVDYPVTIRLSA